MNESRKMADQPQPQRSATRRVLQAARVVFRSTRREGYLTPEESQLATERPSSGEVDEEVVFEALPAVRRRSEPQDPSRTGRQEAAEAGPISQELVPLGDERPPDRTLSERTSSSDDFLPYGSVHRIARCCRKRKSRHWLLGALACVIVVAILAPVITISVRSKPAPVTPSPPPSWLPWRNRTDDNGLPRLLLWNPGEPEQPPSHGNITDDGDHSLFNTTVCKVDGSRDPEVCEITDNRRRLIRSDAIVFFAEHLDPKDLPALRAVPQVWVFWAKHRLPPVGKGTAYNPSLSLPLLADIFNWTMSKRGDADVVLPHKTFRCPASGGKPRAKSLDRHDDAASLPPKGDIAWILDDCELNRFESELKISRRDTDQSGKAAGAVRIRLFPDCGVTLCGTPAECVRYIAERYHFILVSLWPECFQSVYELIYEAFEYDLVPVVLMPPKGTLNVPENSVITSAKLRGKGQLAKYLRTVLDKPDKFRSFFAWKQSCTVVPPGADICALCHAMWEIPMRHRSHPNVLEWWTRPTLCQDEPLYGLDSAFVEEH